VRQASRIALLCLALAAAAGAARADDLADANQLLSQKKYPQALQMFSKLADAGHAEAQLRLGEMYWYGEGVGVDRAKGDALFAKAAAQGHQGAVAATALSGQRAARGSEIAKWTGLYDGAELRTGAFACKTPVIPAESISNADIKAKATEIDHWVDCHNGFVRNVQSALPAGKAIPEDVLVLMNETEITQARLHLEQVYARVLAAAQSDADAVLAKREAWSVATLANMAKSREQHDARTRQTLAEQSIYLRNVSANPILGRSGK
jgi:TPR repeat protein